MLKIYQLRKKQNTFSVTLKYKGVGVRVEFTDGNTYSGTPAKCYTRDPFKQKAIEASQLFKEKEIVLERSIPEAADSKIKVPERKVSKHIGAVVQPVRQPEQVASEKQVIPVQKAPEPEQAPETEENAVTDNTAEDNGTSKMTFDNVGEAIQYVAEHYQIEARSEKEARDILKEHGIVPTIKRG